MILKQFFKEKVVYYEKFIVNYWDLPRKKVSLSILEICRYRLSCIISLWPFPSVDMPCKV